MKLLLEITKEDLDSIDAITKVHVTQLHLYNPDVNPITNPWHRLAMVRKHLGLNNNYDSNGMLGEAK